MYLHLTITVLYPCWAIFLSRYSSVINFSNPFPMLFIRRANLVHRQFYKIELVANIRAGLLCLLFGYFTEYRDNGLCSTVQSYLSVMMEVNKVTELHTGHNLVKCCMMCCTFYKALCSYTLFVLLRVAVWCVEDHSINFYSDLKSRLLVIFIGVMLFSWNFRWFYFNVSFGVNSCHVSRLMFPEMLWSCIIL